MKHMANMEQQKINAEVVRIIHKLAILEVYDNLVTRTQGLTQAEAEARLKDYGRNAIKEISSKPLIYKFLSNFTHLMALLLWAGGIVGFIAQLPQLGVAIWMVNIINGVFSFMQEYRAEKAVEMLRKLLPFHSRVIRDGEEQSLLAEELVPGDVILLAEGDRISADARLVEDSDLRVDQSTLTGESRSIHKTKDVHLRAGMTLVGQPNLIFAGTTVAVGDGKAVVYATGMNTEFGKIAGLTQKQEEEPSPLQKELARLTRTISIMVIGIGIFFFAAAVLIAKVDIAESFIFAMGMIVAFVPEGLLPTVTLSLAMGVQRMAKRNALIKRLSAVETLGCTTVVCTDKTGTLTKNEMTVSNIWTVDQQYRVTGVGYAPEGQILKDEQPITQATNSTMRELLVAAVLCNNAHVVPPDEASANWTVLGDPTEAAMQVAAQKGGLDLLAEVLAVARRQLANDTHLPDNLSDYTSELIEQNLTFFGFDGNIRSAKG